MLCWFVALAGTAHIRGALMGALIGPAAPVRYRSGVHTNGMVADGRRSLDQTTAVDLVDGARDVVGTEPRVRQEVEDFRSSSRPTAERRWPRSMRPLSWTSSAANDIERRREDRLAAIKVPPLCSPGRSLTLKALGGAPCPAAVNTTVRPPQPAAGIRRGGGPGDPLSLGRHSISAVRWRQSVRRSAPVD